MRFHPKHKSNKIVIQITAYCMCHMPTWLCCDKSWISIRDATIGQSDPGVRMKLKWLAEASWGGDPSETLISACLARPRLPLLIDIHYLEWLFIPAKYPEEVLVCMCACMCECVWRIQIALCCLLLFQLGEKGGDSRPGGGKWTGS